MKMALKVHNVWEAIDPGITDSDKNNLATALLFQSIPETLTLQVGALDTAKAVWEAIQSRYVGADRVREARLQTLMTEFDRLKMKDSDSIDDFSGKLTEISSKATALGESIEESKLVKKFLSSVPKKKFIHIVASLEQVLDLKTTGFEDIVGRLKTYEDRVCTDEDPQEEQNKLMYANMEPKPIQPNYQFNGGNRGRGRGGRFYGQGGRGQGGRGRGQQNYNYRQGRNMSKVICYRCDKTGHFAQDCPDRLLKLQEVQEEEEIDTQEADELILHEIVFLNEQNVVPSNYETSSEDDIWYLDNGASNHMTGNHMYFTKIDRAITGKVRFGDDSRIDIKGKGSISFIDKNGEKRVMTDVYFIPELKSNIISLGQATESGCDVRMREDYLTLHDQDGKLLVKATRSKNRLYKVRMGLINNLCLQIKTMSDSAKWHARLGHINTENMRSMIQRKLVIGVPCLNIEK